MTASDAFVDVRPQHRFDEAALAAYLREQVPGYSGNLTVRQVAGGQSNPTYLLEAGGRRYVLRRKPPGELQPSAHAVDREYRVLTALWETPVPVPRTLVLCEDPEVIGTAFYVMDFVDGRIFHEQDMPGVPPADRSAIVRSMIETLAALHNVDAESVGLGDFGRQGAYVERQIARWSKIYRASETVHIPAMESLLEWLPANIPPHDETTIIHGDFRLGNLITHPTDPRIVGVLDWELSTLGHPLADLAYNCLLYRFDEGLDGFKNMDTRALGLLSEAECVEQYCELTGRNGIPNWEFYLAFSGFRLAAICQGIAGRVRDGTASAPDAAERGARAAPLAEAAWGIVAG